MTDSIVNQYIQQLALQPHPEGGFYKETFRSEQQVRRGGEERAAGTGIYYLLSENDFSAWHKLTSDEMWLLHDGDPLAVHVISPEGELIRYVLGNPLETEGTQLQIAIPKEHWFAAELLQKEQSFVLVGCTVMPGFEFQDFTLANRSESIASYPNHKEIINRLTRE